MNRRKNRGNVCLDLLERIENDKNVFKHVITGDKTWIFEYDPDTKRQVRSGKRATHRAKRKQE